MDIDDRGDVVALASIDGFLPGAEAGLVHFPAAGAPILGSRSGRRVLRMGDRIDADDLPILQGDRCASVSGVSIHANVAVPARDRRRLERLPARRDDGFDDEAIDRSFAGFEA